MSASETLRIAHTARCKLQLAADRPDRNLRFILGHAFTLDKLRLRIMEIEEGEDDAVPEPTPAQQRRVSFSGKSKPTPSGLSDSRRSPPPPPQLEDDLEDDEVLDEDEDEEDEDDALSLRRFGSAAAQAPRIAGEEDDSPDEDEDDNSPMFSDDQLKAITAKQADPKLRDAYTKVARCPCHATEAPAVENFWEVPQAEGNMGPRVAVVQIAAAA